MEIEQRQDNGVTILALDGEFDSSCVSDLRSRIDGLVDEGVTRVVLNLSALRFINSTALSYLVGAHGELKSQGGEITFSEPSSFLQSTIRTLELHHIFEVFDDDAAAVRHLKAS